MTRSLLTEATPLTDTDARLRLDTAVRHLTEPTVEQLDRVDRALDSIAAAQAREDRDVEQGLIRAHARLLRLGHTAQAATVLSRLRAHRRIVAERTARQDVREAVIPPLLDLVRDAVESSSGGGVSCVGPHRSPIGLNAVALLHTIERVTRAPRDRALTDHVRDWAATVDDIATAADLAEQWLEQARAIITPPRRWTHPGACPACGKSVAYVTDESGQQVRRPALELDRTHAAARCLRCGAVWRGEGQLRSLARVLEES